MYSVSEKASTMLGGKFYHLLQNRPEIPSLRRSASGYPPSKTVLAMVTFKNLVALGMGVVLSFVML